MKVCILGATGRVGSQIMKFALQDDSYDVTVLARDSNRIEMAHENLQVIEGNVLNENDLKKVLKGVNIVISALGTDGNGTLTKSMPNIIKGMEEEGIHKILTIGTAGILQARTNPSIYRFQSKESKRKTTTAAEDHLGAYEALENSKLCWTIVCPTHLIDGDVTGVYRIERDMLPEEGAKITVGDTAHFTWELRNKSTYENSRVGIAY
ncbi:NAD-dependent epimerase/dehydratase family protein [Bacillus clarus]|uniref:3-beta hydroxysteroid dehydrogenase/isomerase family protein n=1 Tax=Bacillus clarus TaxID=2338372 RepID=A0A090YVJ6_9BACI|nr:NAD(P)H-binding protein [Bacillus clarus]KFN02435.1 3-beta hydroxysteroid dehydrogenase/isomerase family protein [Bacillus clarus]RFT67075.1 NAD-dependent epimerase/dehydratase family protein [Bacillus clarus]